MTLVLHKTAYPALESQNRTEIKIRKLTGETERPRDLGTDTQCHSSLFPGLRGIPNILK